MLIYSSLQLWVALLILVRIATTIAVLPLLTGQGIPAPAKIGFSTLMAAVLYPLVPKIGIMLPATLWEAAMTIGVEAIFGLVFGFVAHLIFLAVQFAGQLIDLQVGLGMANVMDPALDPQVTVLGKFHYILAVLIFLTVGAHHWVLEALARSFQILPLGGFNIEGALAKKLNTLTAQVFVIVIKIAAPIMITTTLTNLAMGILGRVVPQINLFVAGFPVLVSLGLMVLAFSLPLLVKVMKSLFIGLQRELLMIPNLIR